MQYSLKAVDTAFHIDGFLFVVYVVYKNVIFVWKMRAFQ